MADEPEDEMAEISPEEAERIYAAMPAEVRAEIEKTADEENKELIHKFEMHAMDYEKEHPESAA